MLSSFAQAGQVPTGRQVPRVETTGTQAVGTGAVIFRLWPYARVIEDEDQKLRPWGIAACRGYPFDTLRADGER